MKQLIDRLRRQMHGMAARCVLRLASDGLKMQAVQVGLLDGETADDVERFQNYGFTSVPQAGAEGVCLFLGADRAHGVVIAMDDRRYRIKGLQGGEVAIYTDEEDSIVLKRGHLIEVTTHTLRLKASEQVIFETPSLTMRGAGGGSASASLQGTLHTTGNVSTDADHVAGAVSLRGHVHPEHDGGSTGAPAGGA